MKGGVIQTVKVNGKECKGLIDTGCSRTIVSPKVNVRPESIVAHSRGEILSFNGQAVPHDGEAVVAIEMAGRKVMVRAIMCARVLEGTDVIVGMDVLSQYVVTINRGQLNVAAVAIGSGRAPHCRRRERFNDGVRRWMAESRCGGNCNGGFSKASAC